MSGVQQAKLLSTGAPPSILLAQNARYGEVQVEYGDKGEIPPKANKHYYLSIPSF